MDLELVSTVDLVNELARRHDAVVFAGISPDDHDGTLFKTKGGYAATIGLTELLKTDVLDKRRKLDEVM